MDCAILRFMPFEYHCQSYWPQTTTARGAPMDAGAVTRWLNQMAQANWELLSVVQAGDDVRPSEVLYYFRRQI